MANDHSRWVDEILRALETGCKPKEGILPLSFSQEEVLGIVRETTERLGREDSGFKKREEKIVEKEQELSNYENRILGEDEELGQREEELTEKKKELTEKEKKNSELTQAVLVYLENKCSPKTLEQLKKEINKGVSEN